MIDTFDEQLNMLAVIEPTPFRVLPVGDLTEKIRQATFLQIFGDNLALPAPTATVGGSVLTNLTEDRVVTGGETITITLNNREWISAGFDAQRQAIINGLTATTSQTNGWNNEVRDKEVVTAVARTSNTVVTVTLSPSPLYAIDSRETVIVTVPSAAVELADNDFVATPSFDISLIGQIEDTSGQGNNGSVIGEVVYIPFNTCTVGACCNDVDYIILPGTADAELQGWFKKDQTDIWRFFESHTQIPEIERDGNDFVLKNGCYAHLMMSGTSVDIGDFNDEFGDGFS